MLEFKYASQVMSVDYAKGWNDATSAVLKEQTGSWTKDTVENTYCSKCGERIPLVMVGDEEVEIHPTPCCPWCGCVMENWEEEAPC